MSFSTRLFFEMLITKFSKSHDVRMIKISVLVKLVYK